MAMVRKSFRLSSTVATSLKLDYPTFCVTSKGLKRAAWVESALVPVRSVLTAEAIAVLLAVAEPAYGN